MSGALVVSGVPHLPNLGNSFTGAEVEKLTGKRKHHDKELLMFNMDPSIVPRGVVNPCFAVKSTSITA